MVFIKIKTLDISEYRKDIKVVTKYAKKMARKPRDKTNNETPTESLVYKITGKLEEYENYIDKHVSDVEDPELYLLRLGFDAYYNWDFDYEYSYIADIYDDSFKSIISKYFPKGCSIYMYQIFKFTYFDYCFRCIEYVIENIKPELKDIFKL